ncbi:hypothetical protein BDQ12DRAFT_569624, partial [Crucibulum laeve]
ATEVQQCASMSITVQPAASGSVGVPPFYMLAFPVGGTPSTTLAGTNTKTINYQFTQPVGSEVMLNLADSTGNSGGIPQVLYKVVAGQNSQCVSSTSNSPEFTVTSNVTEVDTCQPWGLTMKGGVAPYFVTIAALDSGGVTNVTMPAQTDVYTYINRALPGSHLIGLIILSSTGRWASGTPLVTTKG